MSNLNEALDRVRRKKEERERMEAGLADLKRRIAELPKKILKFPRAKGMGAPIPFPPERSPGSDQSRPDGPRGRSAF